MSINKSSGDDIQINLISNVDSVDRKYKNFANTLGLVDSVVKQLSNNFKNLHKYTDRQKKIAGDLLKTQGRTIKYDYQYDDVAIANKAVERELKKYGRSATRMSVQGNPLTRQMFVANQIKEAEVSRDELATLSQSKIYIQQKAKLKSEELALQNRINNKLAENTAILQEQANIQEKLRIAKETAKVNAQLQSTQSLEYKQLQTKKQQLEEQKKLVQQQKQEEDSVAKTYIKRAAILMILRKMVNLSTKALNISADWYENLNLFAVTFGSTYEDTVNWAVDFAEQLGYSTVEIVRFTGLFKQLSDAIGVANETGSQLSVLLTQLGADISSFYNITLESAMEKLQAGIFSGQTKPLRAVGIDVTYQSIDNLLQSNAVLSQLGITSKKLSQDQKVLARAILATNAAMNAWGDSAITINSLANQVKVLQGGIQNLGLAIGDVLNEPLRKVIITINGIIMALTVVIRSFQPLVTTVGREVEDMVETVSDEYADLEEAAGKLLSFDKFEVLNDQSEDQNATAALTAELEKIMAQYMEQQADALENISNDAIKVRDVILETLGYKKDENGEWVKTSNILNVALTTLGLYLALSTGSMIISAISKINNLTKATNALGFALKKLPILIIIAEIVELITNFKELNALQIFLRASLIALTVWWTLFLNKADAMTKLKTKIISFFTSLKKNIDTTKISALGLSATIAGITVVLALIISYWDDMSSWQKAVSVIGALTAAFFSLALSLGVLKSIATPWKIAGIVAGVTLVSGAIIGAKMSAKGYANGGIPEKSELFYMNEYGRPEALVNTGGSQTNVINQTQMQSLIKQGFIEAIAETGLISTIRDSRPNIELGVNGQQLFTVVNKEGKRITGKDWRGR